MAINLRLPNITGRTAEEKISQLQSYLYQVVEELNLSLTTVNSSIESKGSYAKSSESASKNTQSAQNVFNSIKDLIIKSADIINAYCEELQKTYDGLYVAESDFGTFQQETNQKIIENSQSITSLFVDLQTINAEVKSSMTTNAWIRTGLIDEVDGVPVYGVEVGQSTEQDSVTVFNKFARFTAGGIYFYLPGISDPVAWMSGTTLHIKNAEISSSLKLGGYMLDLSDGIAFKWVGGD